MKDNHLIAVTVISKVIILSNVPTGGRQPPPTYQIGQIRGRMRQNMEQQDNNKKRMEVTEHTWLMNLT